MKIDENGTTAFKNAAMDDEECLASVFNEKTATVGLETEESNQKQTFVSASKDDSPTSSLPVDRWRKLSREIRDALVIKNAAVKSHRWRTGRKSAGNIDPFLRRFSTREIGLTTQISGASLHSLEDENEELSPMKGCRENLNENQESGFRVLPSTLRRFSTAVVIDPDGAFLYYWLYFLITAVRYNLWVIILRYAFAEAQEDHASLWWALDSVADVIYLIDIIVHCQVGFLEEGILVKDAKLVRRRYLLSWRFILDVISILPLEFLYFETGVKPILRFPRLVKTYKSQEMKGKVEGRANNPTIVRVFFLVHLMLLMLHWNAGIYFLISRAEGFGTNSWGYPALNGSHDTLTRKYMHSFYWSALTLTTIGDLPSPQTNIEYLYTIACYLSGVFVFAMIVGNAGSIIVDRNACRMEFEKQRDNAKNYMKMHNVPRDLQRRVVKWYDYSWSRGRMNGGGGDLNSLHLLPDKMKTEVALHVHLETLKKVTFLQNCEPEFLHELLLKMRLHIFTPGDLIIRHGEIAREMYLIAHGRIEVISETGKFLKELGSGDFFGEIGILSLSEGQNRRTADVRSIGYTECFVLSKDDVLGEIHQFPHAQKILAEYGRKRLKNTSGDPRLVKLDGQSSPVAKNRWQATRSHIVSIPNEKQVPRDPKQTSSYKSSPSLSGLFKSVSNEVVLPSLNSPGNTQEISDKKYPNESREHSNVTRNHSNRPRDEWNETRDPSNELRDYSSGSRSFDGPHVDARGQYVLSAREARGTNMSEKGGVGNTEKLGVSNCYTHGSTNASRKCGSVADISRDIGACLNTLDYLKAVMQSTMHETEKQNEYVTQLEQELSLEKEKVFAAEEKINSQAEEIRRLLENNKTLRERIKKKDGEISDMECQFKQMAGQELTQSRVSTELSNEVTQPRHAENVLLQETVLNISNTQC